MAIVLPILKWKHYLLGRKFIIYTDQKSLKYIMEQRQVLPGYQKWVSKIMCFNFEIKYKEGKENRAVNALSRQDNTVKLSQLEISQTNLLDIPVIKEEIRRDAQLVPIINAIEEGKESIPPYQMDQGIMTYDGQIILSKESALILTIL